MGEQNNNQYYDDIYNSNWSALPVAKDYNRENYENIEYQKISGNSHVYTEKEDVHIEGVHLKVHWKNSYKKYGNALYVIKRCKNVIIENIAIVQLDSDYRASHSILIEGCENVVIKNSYFAGTNNNSHIRIEGCENVLIDNVEISGVNYGELGYRSGGGILVVNGETGLAHNGFYSTNPLDLKMCTIQNCYLHDNRSSDGVNRNLDGIAMASCANGIIFNCFWKDWFACDSALDLSHRRTDGNYRSKFFRVERNVFNNSKCVKVSGGKGDKNSIIYFVNNILMNTFVGDYHKGYDVYFLYSTFVVKNPATSFFPFYKLWGIDDGNSFVQNCAVIVLNSDRYAPVIYQSDNESEDEYMNFKPDYNLYVIPKLGSWLSSKNKGTIFSDLAQLKKKLTVDVHSIFMNSGVFLKDIDHFNFKLVGDESSLKIANHIYISIADEKRKVSKDFYGNIRNNVSTVGAIE